MTTDNNASPLAQVLTGALLGGICAFAISIDITNNLKYFGPINPEMAGMTVVAAICIAVLPWKRWGVLKGACLALTCWAAVAAYANSLGLDISKNVNARSSHASAVADASTARTTLARITETADTATLTTMVAAAEAKAKAAEQKAREQLGEADATACLKQKACRQAAADLQTLLGRLAEAKARDDAQARIAKADAKADAVGTAKVDVLATKLATAANADYESTAQTQAIVQAILIIAVTQGAALLGHTALTMIGNGTAALMARRRQRKPVEAKATKARAKAVPHKLTKAEALAILRAHIHERGGEMLARPSQIAKLFPGVSRSTVCGPRGWLAQWTRDDELEGDVNKDATTIWRGIKRTA